MRFLAVFSVLCLVTCLGCGDDTPPLGTVIGTVTMDGKPFAGGSLQFVPAGGGRPSIAVTNDEGEFEALYLIGKKGALLGSHSVKFELASEKVDEADQFKPPSGSRKGPKGYSISPDTIDVVAGKNEIEFKLVSK